jgi:DNA repair exonuclease SbcCD ATPase subunit
MVGLNVNYTSRTGTLYHIQVEDRGPLLDRISENWVRRVNLIVYANYGEPNARIVHGSDRDLEDVRTADHNRFVEGQIQQLAEQARKIIEERESREVERIKALVRQYYRTKDEVTKQQFEAANTFFPFLFSRAWRELREEKARLTATAPSVPSPPLSVPAASEARFPLNPQLRERLKEVERMIGELGESLEALRERGRADDILLQTCRKLVLRAQEALASERPTDFDVRRLDKTYASLLTTCRQVRSRLKAAK